MNITKTLAFDATELKFNGDAGSFKGYASVWGGVDSYQDTILKGAFLDTLKENGFPKMFYMHKHDMPIGKYTLVDEDSKGLWVEGELTPNHSLSMDVRAAMVHETLDGLSIGGMLRKGDYKDGNNNGRIIHKWTRLLEVSPVVFPADSAARVDASTVKSEEFSERIAEIKSPRDLENFLRDASGYSKGAALELVARVMELSSLWESEKAQAKANDFTALVLQRLEKLSA